MTPTTIRREAATILSARRCALPVRAIRALSCASVLGVALAAAPAAALATLVTAGSAAAQTTAPQSTAPQTPPSGTAQSMPQAQSPAVDISEDKLESFAAASLEIEDLNEQWSPRAAAAESEADQQAIRNEAMNKMTEAVADQGLTVTEYNTIAQVVQADPRIAQRVLSYRESMQ